MSTLQLSCPICDCRLQLPAEAAGQTAQCPACEATFHVAKESPAPPPQPILASIEPDSESNPFASPLKSASVGPTKVNPYQPSIHSEPVVILGDVEIMTRSIEEIVSPTWMIFRARFGQLILAFFLAFLVGAIAFLAAFAVLYTIEQRLGDTALITGILICGLLGCLLGSYLAVGLARNAIAVVRNDPSPLREMLPPPQVVGRFIASGAVFGIVIALAMASLLAILFAVARAFGAEGIAFSFVVISAVGGTALSLVASWLLWPWVFLISDGKTTALGSIRLAWELTMHNKQTSALLVVIAFVLWTAGASAFNVGLLITQPLTHLMFAIAFLQMTNQTFNTDHADQTLTPQD